MVNYRSESKENKDKQARFRNALSSQVFDWIYSVALNFYCLMKWADEPVLRSNQDLFQVLVQLYSSFNWKAENRALLEKFTHNGHSKKNSLQMQ